VCLAFFTTTQPFPSFPPHLYQTKGWELWYNFFIKLCFDMLLTFVSLVSLSPIPFFAYVGLPNDDNSTDVAWLVLAWFGSLLPFLIVPVFRYFVVFVDASNLHHSTSTDLGSATFAQEKCLQLNAHLFLIPSLGLLLPSFVHSFC